jgi:hypothetical protein
LAELKCGQNELKLGKKEVTKMTQTLKQSTLKDLPATYIKEIIATMQKMTIAQDRVNENLVKAIIEIVRSLPKKPHWEAMETPKAMKTIKTQVITLYRENASGSIPFLGSCLKAVGYY